MKLSLAVFGIGVVTLGGCGGGNTGDSREEKSDTKPLLTKEIRGESILENLNLDSYIEKSSTGMAKKICFKKNINPRFMNFHQCVIFFDTPASIKNRLIKMAVKLERQLIAQDKGFAREIHLKDIPSKPYQEFFQIIKFEINCYRVVLIVVNKWDFPDSKPDNRGYLWIKDVTEINFSEIFDTAGDGEPDLNELSADVSMGKITGGKDLTSAIFYNQFLPLEYVVFDLKRCISKKYKRHNFDAKIYFFEEQSN